MTGTNDPSSSPRRGVSIPGQPTEEAAAEVASAAGKTLVRGLARLGSATVSEWVAKREAKAEAARIAIETDTKIKTDATLAASRREHEVVELDHRGALERRAARLRAELAREQLNLEAIERRAIEYAEDDPRNETAQELDDDWLFRFADLAQRVSDKNVQELWARALSSAAIEGVSKLSAQALQTLSLFDKAAGESFQKFVAVVSRLGRYPHVPDGEQDPQQIDLGALADLDVISERSHHGPIEFNDFTLDAAHTGNLGLGLLQTHVGLTRRGYDIAIAVFREELPLSNEDELQYLQWLLQQQVRLARNVRITTKPVGSAPTLNIRITNKSSSDENHDAANRKLIGEASLLSERLKNLLLNVAQAYDIEIK